jgi:soluble lytic murein transglycosylase-like protein
LSAHVLKTYHTQLKDWDKTFKAYNVGIGNFNKKKQLSAQTRYLRKINRELNSIAVFKEERKYAKL